MHVSRRFPVLLLASLASGQVQIPPYAKTSSNAGETHGFWFRAPVPILIIGLRVPDEARNGLQSVEVFRLANPPPAFAAYGTGGQVFYSAGTPSGDVVPCALLFNAGEYACILGGCGTTKMLSSDGPPGTLVSSVVGQPILLTRFVTYTNLLVSGGNQPYSSQPALEIGRVEVYVLGQNVALDYGAGTPSNGSALAPSLTTTARPVLGRTATLGLTNHDPSCLAAAVWLAVGRGSYPVLGGTFLLQPPILVTFALGAPAPGTTPLAIPIPNDPALITGPGIDFQGFVLTGSSLAMTNGTEWWLGL